MSLEAINENKTDTENISLDNNGQSSAESAPKSGKKKKKKRSALSYALSLLLKVGLTAAAVWVLLTYVGGVFMCHNNSAYPMIKDGDLIITYRLDPLRQGDVVAYIRDSEVHFGRIVAVAGDTIDFSGDYVSINGYGLYEDTVYPTSSAGAAVGFPYTVQENCVFVLNDYRSDISDSRTYGAIPVSDIQGKAVFVMRRRGI